MRCGAGGRGEGMLLLTGADVSLVSTKYRSKLEEVRGFVVSLKFLLERAEDETWAEAAAAAAAAANDRTEI